MASDHVRGTCESSALASLEGPGFAEPPAPFEFPPDLRDLRAEHGSQGGRIFKSPANQNEVVVLFEWDSEEEARKFMEEVIPAKRWERARIYSYEMHFLEHVEDLDA